MEEAILVLSKEIRLSEEKIIKLCVLSVGMGGLLPFDYGKTGTDSEGVMEFLRGLWMTRGVYGRKSE